MPRRVLALLTSDPIDPAVVIRSVADPGGGAVVLFLGTVRDNNGGRRVKGIEYEAYGPMAERRIAKIEEEAKARWPSVLAVQIVHRIGELKVGDTSVAIAVSSPHRAEAYEACRYAIETIKHEVPIWKRERMADGTAVWVEGNPIPIGGLDSAVSDSKKAATGHFPSRRPTKAK